jgi:hypothetical protein
MNLDLASDMEPPKELLIQIKVLEDCGEILTDAGPGTHYYTHCDTVYKSISPGHGFLGTLMLYL